MKFFAVRQLPFPEVSIFNVLKDSLLILGYLHNLPETAKSSRLHSEAEGFMPYLRLEVIKSYCCTTPAHVNLNIQTRMLRLCGVEHVLSSLMMVQYNHPECHSSDALTASICPVAVVLQCFHWQSTMGSGHY